MISISFIIQLNFRELSHFEYEAVESALALQETNRCLQETETSISKLLETEQNLKQIIIEQEKQTASLRTIRYIDTNYHDRLVSSLYQ